MLTRVDGENQNIRASIETVEGEHKRVQEELTAKKDDLESKVAQLEADRNARSAGGGGRDAIVKRLPAILYRRYEQLRTKRGTAIAQTTDGTCKACNMALPPQLFHKLRREPLLEQCPSCNRIIYYQPPQTATKVD